MLSWEEWKKRIISLVNWPIAVCSCAWTAAKRRPTPAIIFGVIAIVGCGAVYYWQRPIVDFLTHAKDGKIFVNSPTVYTRQRLVNDRLDQAHWLRAQLEFTEKEREKDFKSIDQLKNIYSNTQGSFGEERGEKPPEKPTLGSISVEATTTALFRAKNAYREEVRSEITQTELDDRHDIRGNTIFRLAFDASILAGKRKDSVAGITIKLSHRPEIATDVKMEVYNDDYQSLYEDWARYFQDTIRKSLTIVPQSIASPDPIPQLRILFTEFLLRRICQFVRNDPDLTKDPVACEGNERRRAEALLAAYNKQRFTILNALKIEGFTTAIAGYVAAGYTLPPGNSLPTSDPSLPPNAPPPASTMPTGVSLPPGSPAPSLAQLFGTAASACAEQQKTEIALWELKIKLPQTESQRPPPNQQGTSSIPAKRSNQPVQNDQSSQDGPPAPKMAAGQGTQGPSKSNFSDDRIGCPFYDRLPERLISGVLLYENLYLTATAPGDIKPGDFDAHRLLALAELKDCTVGACQVNSSRLRCFAADFIKSNLNLFHELDGSEEHKIKHYLKLQIVGRGVNDCNIQVSALGKANIDSLGRSYSPLSEFIRSLNRGTDAFAYSVTPKNLTENISTAAETRDAFELMYRTRSDSKQIANLLRQRSEQNQAIVAHPIVVGFGTPNDARRIGALGGKAETTAGIRDIDFGWIVAPRSRIGGVLEQIDGQYPLTVFISVPAWWRTAEVEIKTCWLSRISSAELKAPADICPDTPNSQRSAVTVRLPSAIPEISRKLGFDVVQQPSLYEPRQKELFVGAPGALLLEGARLWRSTEVTAGAQRADKISVLPNMEGILAEFKCVLPPAGQRQIRQNTQVDDDDTQTITMDSVRVWTSEGVTDPIPVVFVWPKQWAKLLADCQNPRPTQTAAQSTAQAAANAAPAASPVVTKPSSP